MPPTGRRGVRQSQGYSQVGIPPPPKAAWGCTELRTRRDCGASGHTATDCRKTRHRRPHGPAGWPRGARLRTGSSHKAKNHTTGHVGARGLPRERQRTGATEARGPSLPFVACATKGESCCAGEALHPMGQTAPRRRISRGWLCIIGGGVCRTAKNGARRREITADYGGRTL